MPGPTLDTPPSQLPDRLWQQRMLTSIRRRGEQMLRDGWDINVLILLAADTRHVLEAHRDSTPSLNTAALAELVTQLGTLAQAQSLPDADTSSVLAEQFAALASDNLAPTVEMQASLPATMVQHVNTDDSGFPLLARPPAEYATRMASSAPAPAPASIPPAVVAMPAIGALPASDSPAPGAAGPPHRSAATAALEQPPHHSSAAIGTLSTRRFAVHLPGNGALVAALDAALSSSGIHLEACTDFNSLMAYLQQAAPQGLILGDLEGDQLDQLTALLQAMHGDSRQRPALLMLGDGDDLQVRLQAMRAGCDAFITRPVEASDVVAQLQRLEAERHADPYRVLIIEDDRSQALFADAILRRNGMQTLVVDDANAVLEQLQHFQPDLILMDLHMPQCSGIELTALIREHAAFIATPIVFLSGEDDTEQHFAALSAGGDDFLAKPIQPRHLISAVTNRARRARQMKQAHPPDLPSRPVVTAPATAAPAPVKVAASTAAAIDLAMLIAEALAADSLQLMFQPIVSLHGESDERFQALLRLPLADGRILAAGELVPAAEASGLIAEVDRWVLERCLDTMRQHQQEGRVSRLFASQSLASVRHPGLLTWLQQALQARPVPPQHLCMELRGSDVLLALEEVTTFALAVRALGIRLAVSEVDATNAVALLALPIHFIKLSSHYTDIRDPGLRDELRQLVDQAHERDLSVIAPRVEEAHAAALLWSTGVDLIQGNFVQQVARELSYDFTASST